MREVIGLLAEVQDKAVLEGFGLTCSSDGDSSISQSTSCSTRGSDCEWTTEDETIVNTSLEEQQSGTINAESNKDISRNPRRADPDVALEKNRPLVSPVPDMEHLLLIFWENSLNWFAFVGELKTLLQNYSEETVTYALTDFSDNLENMDLTDEEMSQVEISREAYIECERQKAMQDEAWITDCDSGNPDDLLTKELKDQVKQQRQTLKRKVKRILAHRKAEQRLLKRQLAKRFSKILTKFPNIGRDIEEFVRSSKVGADAWRRTGVLTFDGNVKTGPKVTCKRIQ